MQYRISYIILSCAVTLHDGLDEIFRHILIVGEELLCVFRQTIATISKRRVVVVCTDTRVEADALNYRASVHSLHLGVGIEFVEIRHTQCKIRVREEFHCLSFFHSHKEGVDIFLYRSLMQQSCKHLCRLLHTFHVGYF